MEDKNRKSEPLGGDPVPHSYGTGRAPVERSHTFLVVMLLGILLGANLISLGFLSRLGSRQSSVSVGSPSANPSRQPQKDPQEVLSQELRPGLAGIAQKDGSTAMAVILSEDGYLLSNAATVEAAQDASVTLSDGSSYRFRTVGSDEDSDIAVLKISAEDLSPAPYASSDKVTSGDSLTLFSLLPTGAEMTQVPVQDSQLLLGGLYRRIFTVPCDSGSLFVNEEGDLVAFGIGGNGALPMSEAVALAGELILYGCLNDPNSFGMEVSRMDEAQRSYWGLPQGLLVGRLTEQGNAHRAGVQTGDVLLQVGRYKVSDTESYWKALMEYHREDAVQIFVYRSGVRLELLLELQPAS